MCIASLRPQIVIFLSAACITAILTGCHPTPPSPGPVQIKGNWSALSLQPTAYIVATPAGLVAAEYTTDGGVLYFSADHGSTWAQALPTQYLNNTYLLMPDLSIPLNLLAYSYGDSTFYISRNGGQSFTVLNHLGRALGIQYSDSAGYVLNTIYTTPLSVSNNRIFAQKSVSGGASYIPGVTLIKSDDNGNTWDSVFSYTNSVPVQYVITSTPLVAIGSGLFLLNGAVARSNNNGSSWNIINSGSEVYFYAGATSNGSIYCLDYPGANLYVSSDTFQNFTTVLQADFSQNAGLPWLSGALAFDSALVVDAVYNSNWHVLCSNAQKINWFGADPPGASYEDGLLIDSACVYLSSGSTGYFYRRPRSDFKGL